MRRTEILEIIERVEERLGQLAHNPNFNPTPSREEWDAIVRYIKEGEVNEGSEITARFLNRVDGERAAKP